jgi:transposase-like protein
MRTWTGAPEKIVMDNSGANKAAIDAINSSTAAPIVVRQL